MLIRRGNAKVELPKNTFKRRLLAGEQQIGLWCTLPSSFTAEGLATTGFDWLLFDTEHSPADPLTVLPCIQAVAPYPVSAVVRPAINDLVLFKRLLDLGAQTLLVPQIETAEEAHVAVRAIRYPPQGIRGVAGFTRAGRFGAVSDYFKRAEEELCLLVQVETLAALDNVEKIAAVDGVDGIFIGPSDLAASMDRIGETSHSEVIEAIEETIRRIVTAGKPAGILTLDRDFAKRCMQLGTTFTAVDLDAALLFREARRLSQAFRE